MRSSQRNCFVARKARQYPGGAGASPASLASQSTDTRGRDARAPTGGSSRPSAVRGVRVGLAVLTIACLMLAPAVVSAQPVLAVTPTTISPGQSIHVVASGVTAPNQAGATLCVGLLGPGNNVALGVTPSFRPNLGTIAISASGTGQIDVVTPSSLVAGSYQIVLGGCSPHLDIAPLAPIASATIQVPAAASTPTPAPTVSPPKLPNSGGAPAATYPIFVGLAAIAALTGWRLRRQSTRGTGEPHPLP